MRYFGGPAAVSSKGQVSLPAEARRLAAIATGKRVYVAIYEDRPRILLLVPEELGLAWVGSGERSAGI